MQRMLMAPVLAMALSMAAGFAGPGAHAAPGVPPNLADTAAPTGSPSTTGQRPTNTTSAESSTMGALPGTNAAGPKGGATFTSLANAAQDCGGAINVVWGDTRARTYRLRGDRQYGKAQGGTWMCLVDARKNGYRPVGRHNKLRPAPLTPPQAR